MDVKSKPVCKNWLQGHCKYGTSCHFSHPTNSGPPSYSKHQASSLSHPSQHSAGQPYYKNQDSLRSKPKNKIIDIESKLNSIIGSIASGERYNKISIRIVGDFSFTFENGDFKPNLLGNNKSSAKCSVFCKQNDKAKPISFYFDYTKENEMKVEKMIKQLREDGKYDVKDSVSANSPQSAPFCLYHNGDINCSFTDCKSLFYECLGNGNLRLNKKNYMDKNEGFRIEALIGGENHPRIYKAKYLYNDFQIIDSNLAKQKGLSSPSHDSMCVCCLDEIATHAMVPCGHKCVCQECSVNSWSFCPMCRRQVQNVIKIF